MIAFQFPHWPNPSEIFGYDFLPLPVDRKRDVTILLAEAKAEDLLKADETHNDFFPLLVIDGMCFASFVLSLIQSSQGIIKDGFSCRGPG